jgi:hypothetical protein
MKQKQLLTGVLQDCEFLVNSLLIFKENDSFLTSQPRYNPEMYAQ